MTPSIASSPLSPRGDHRDGTVMSTLATCGSAAMMVRIETARRLADDRRSFDAERRQGSPGRRQDG